MEKLREFKILLEGGPAITFALFFVTCIFTMLIGLARWLFAK